MFPNNRLNTFYTSDITQPFPQHRSPTKVNDVIFIKHKTHTEILARSKEKSSTM